MRGKRIICMFGQTMGGNTYPDAYVMQFQTGGGKITVNTDPSAQEPVVNPDSANMPRTGDRSALALWVTLTLLAGCGMLVLARRGENNG